MPLFRALLVVFAIAVASCVAAFLFTGERKYLRWVWLMFRIGIAAALAFFAVLIIDRIV
jgi:hypothetical protein